jgi:RHS repeat-associated protein
MRLTGATRNLAPTIAGRERQPGISNYIRGNDPAQWRSGVPHYAKVQYDQVYPGIDLVYYGNPQQLEYDLVVAPGADPGQIRLSFEGVDGMRIDDEGNLVLAVAGGEIVQKAPRVFQLVEGQERLVAGRYVMLDEGSASAAGEGGATTLAASPVLGIALASYDTGRALVIDPVVVYSTYLGGSGLESYGSANGHLASIAVDGAGNAYVTGNTYSTDFPAVNARYPSYGGGGYDDAFVTKFNQQGQGPVYSTYLGGNSSDFGYGIAVDRAGNAYVTGSTSSTDFPTVNAHYPNYGGGSDAFVTKLDPQGQGPIYSTFLGGSSYDGGKGIAVDGIGNASVTGSTLSFDFPTVNARYPNCNCVYGTDAFVTKLDPQGHGPVFSTYLGGYNWDYGEGIAVDAVGNAYITGHTTSPDFPTVNARYPIGSGWSAAFVTKFDSQGQGPVYSTYLGGYGYNYGLGIAVDGSGNVYVVGYTDSSYFPTVNARYPNLNGSHDAFVTKFDPQGQGPVYSTYLGGSSSDGGYGIAVDGSGNSYVVGFTNSSDFPIANAIYPNYGGNADVFVTKFDQQGQGPIYSTYLGGSGQSLGTGVAVDGAGNAYVTGSTSSTDFPTVNARYPTLKGETDAFVTKIASNDPPPSVILGPVGGPSNPTGVAAEPVNTATGNYYYQHTDLTLPGRGVGFALTRTYNAQDGMDGPFGRGWTHSYQVRLTENPDGSVVIRHGDGHTSFYDPNGDGTYRSRYAGVYERLVKQSATDFLLTAKDQTSRAFANGDLTQLSDRNGNVLSFGYDGSGHLTSITDSVGRLVTLSYDANGRLLQLSDPLGRTAQYAYDANGDLVSDTDPTGGLQHYSYDANRRLVRITNRRGQVLVDNVYDSADRVVSQTNGRGLVTTFAYDSPNPGETTITNPLGEASIHRHDDQRRLIAELDPLGHSVQYAYDANNNRTQVTDRNGHITRYSYDARGNVLTQTDALGGVTTLTYDASDRPLTRTDALGQVTTYSYDGVGNLLSETDPLGQSTRYTYDARGQRLSRTDANGHTTSDAYDTQGNRIATTNPLGATTHSVYDAVGRPIRTTDANGHATTFGYDAADRLLTTSDALGQTVAFAYDADGNRTRATDAKGQTTVTAYDANDNVSNVTDPTGAVTAYGYDPADQRITQTDPLGHLTRYGYDAAHRLTSVTDALGQVTTSSFDANGNRLTQTDPLGRLVAHQYDALNRPIRTTDPLGQVTAWQYDALGRRTAMTDALGHTTTSVYDALGRLVQVIDPAGNSTRVTYDAVGNRLSVTNPNGQDTRYTYDAADRRLTETDALDQVTAWQFDAVGNPIQRTDAMGQVTQYGFDAANRLTSIRYADATTVALSHDANGNVTTMVDPLGTTTYVYDARNRLTAHTDPFGATVNQGYDAAGNRLLLTYPDGKLVSYGYDALNRLASVTDWLGNRTDYSYDAAGGLTGSLNGNGTETQYGYDAAGRLNRVLAARADNSVIARDDLTLDAVGNRTAIVRQDPVVPRYVSQNTIAVYDDADRLTALGASPVSHDANGNLLSQPGGSYQYDGDNRLTVANGQGYAYDGQGHRLAATRSGVTTRYVLDLGAPLSQVLMERDSADNPIAYYVHGLGLNARITPSGDARYYHYDANGNTVALTDTGGLITDAYVYSSFGDGLGQQGSTSNPYRFLGQFGVQNEGNGLNFVRARYYHPATGRFVSKDPLKGKPEAGQTLNAYAYALNNPVRFVDVSGLSAKEGGGASSFNGPSDALHRRVLQQGVSSTAYWAAYADGLAVPINFSRAIADASGDEAVSQVIEFGLKTAVNHNGFNVVGEAAFSVFEYLPFIGAAVSGVMEAANVANTDTDWSYKASRVTFAIGWSTVSSLAGRVAGPSAAIATSAFGDTVYDKAVVPLGDIGGGLWYNTCHDSWCNLGLF